MMETLIVKCLILYGSYIKEASVRYNIPERTIIAVIITESSCNKKSVGGAGEFGLMQLHPRFFSSVKRDPRSNIEAGTKHLKYMKKHCKYKSYVICYNRGFKPSANPLNNPYHLKIEGLYDRIDGVFRRYNVGDLRSTTGMGLLKD